jgi:DNA-3-methyladenine glycosylase II
VVDPTLSDLMPRTTNQTGIQKNLCKWFSHDPALAPSIHPRKLAGASPTKLGAAATSAAPESPSKSQSDAQTDTDSAATVPSARKTHEGEGVGLGKLAALGGASVEQELVVDLDQPATPPRTSTKQEEEVVEFAFPETSNNLTPAILKSRLNGKKLKYAGLSFFLLTFTVRCSCITDTV